MCLLLSVWPQPHFKQLSVAAAFQDFCKYSYGCVMSTSMSFFWNLAAAQCLGGRKWTLFFWLRDFKEDDSWQMPRSWWPLVLFEVLDWIEGWCSSTTCHHLLHRTQLSQFWRVYRMSFGLKKIRYCLLPFPSTPLFVLFLLEHMYLSINDFMVSWITGPPSSHGMVNQPSAPKRWCSSAVSFSCFTTERLSHDMTHI